MAGLSIAAPTDRTFHAAARGIVHVCRRLYERGLVAGQDGNVSVRLDDGNIAVTPSGASKADIGESDVVIVTAAGAKVFGSGEPSSELDMHLRIYAHRPDVNAVVHAHPPVATGFSVAGRDFMTDVLPEIVFHMGAVPLVPYAQPGTKALGDTLERYLASHDVFLLERHGATATGSTLLQAHQRMESLEHAARILLTAHTLGSVNALSEPQATALRMARRTAE